MMMMILLTLTLLSFFPPPPPLFYFVPSFPFSLPSFPPPFFYLFLLSHPSLPSRLPSFLSLPIGRRTKIAKTPSKEFQMQCKNMVSLCPPSSSPLLLLLLFILPVSSSSLPLLPFLSHHAATAHQPSNSLLLPSLPSPAPAPYNTPDYHLRRGHHHFHQHINTTITERLQGELQKRRLSHLLPGSLPSPLLPPPPSTTPISPTPPSVSRSPLYVSHYPMNHNALLPVPILDTSSTARSSAAGAGVD